MGNSGCERAYVSLLKLAKRLSMDGKCCWTFHTLAPGDLNRSSGYQETKLLAKNSACIFHLPRLVSSWLAVQSWQYRRGVTKHRIVHKT